MAADNLALRRQEAQQAMEDKAHAEIRLQAGELLAKRRQEAIRAMEGQEWRRRREEKEQAARAAAAATAAAANTTEKQALAAAKAQADELARRREEKLNQEKEFDRRLSDIDYSERLIDKLKAQALTISPLRTLKSDMARAVKEEGMSVAKIAIAQQARQPLAETPATKKSPKGYRGLIVFLLILIVLAGASGFIWRQKRLAATNFTPTPSVPKTIIFADSNQIIALEDYADAATLRQTIAQAKIDAETETLKNLYLTWNESQASWRKIQTALILTPPETLTRSLTNNFMFGIIKAGNQSHHFLLLKTNWYNNARAGLLEWEETMFGDLASLFYQAPPTIKFPVVFKDRLIRNQDARILTNEQGRTVLFYTFIDNQTIAITENEAAFMEIFSRYLSNG